MKNAIRKMVILTLAATIFLSACHRQGIDSENEVINEDTMIAESDQETENNAETQQEIHPLDVGVLGHTEGNGALTAKALEEDYDTQNESFFRQEMSQTNGKFVSTMLKGRGIRFIIMR